MPGGCKSILNLKSLHKSYIAELFGPRVFCFSVGQKIQKYHQKWRFCPDLKKNFNIEERFPSFFFPTSHGTDILELKQAMFNLATSFHMKSRGPSGWKKKWNKKIRKHWRMKKIWMGDLFNSWYFRKYKRMETQHQQFLWTKNNIDLN